MELTTMEDEEELEVTEEAIEFHGNVRENIVSPESAFLSNDFGGGFWIIGSMERVEKENIDMEVLGEEECGWTRLLLVRHSWDFVKTTSCEIRTSRSQSLANLPFVISALFDKSSESMPKCNQLAVACSRTRFMHKHT
jgi:hypothetical protein